LSEEKPKLTIGLAVYNGEEFIEKRIQNIFDQTFQNFELIISDNASTDKTSEICMEFVKKNNNIRYCRQDKNIGGILNYTFVLEKAETDYFVFATADDKWDKDFLLKNIRVLEEDNSIVGSTGKIEWFGKKIDEERKSKHKDTIFNKFYNKLRSRYGRYGSFTIIGETYEDRALIYLRKLITRDPSNILYSVFRTNSLRKNIVPKDFVKEFYSSFWNNACLSVLEYGNIHCSDDVQIYYYAGGSGTGVGPVEQYIRKEITLMQCVFPWATQISWSIHKFGWKFFFKNFIVFLKLFLQGEITFVYSICRYLKNK